MDTRFFPSGCIATPHHLASAAGHTVLATGGNAVDAAVAANLVLAVVTPYHCGVGGDLVAMVWDGRAQAVMSIGAAPAGATPAAVREAAAAGHGSGLSLPGTAGMPTFGALPVTVPGAVAGWFHLLERFGTRTFGDLAGAAVAFAREGFTLSDHGWAHVRQGQRQLAGQPGFARGYGRIRARERVVQERLADTLEVLGTDGPPSFYGGPLGEVVVDTLAASGSTMAPQDLAGHTVEEVTPLTGHWRGLEVLELPPPSQGVAALTALGILARLDGTGAGRGLATHLQVEACRAALEDRQRHLADPPAMRVGVPELLAPDRLAGLAREIDPDRAAARPVGRPAPGGTAYLAAADRDGLLVSLSQSNFLGFGSGVFVEELGIGLHNRGAHFSLDASDPNVIAPGKRPMHTLIPALALRDGEPWLVFGTMGGDHQFQIQVQLLASLLEGGHDVQAAVSGPRWAISLADGSLEAEADFPEDVVEALTARGHAVRRIPARDHAMGHAHALRLSPGAYAGGSDPRCEGAVLGL